MGFITNIIAPCTLILFSIARVTLAGLAISSVQRLVYLDGCDKEIDLSMKLAIASESTFFLGCLAWLVLAIKERVSGVMEMDLVAYLSWFIAASILFNATTTIYSATAVFGNPKHQCDETTLVYGALAVSTALALHGLFILFVIITSVVILVSNNTNVMDEGNDIINLNNAHDQIFGVLNVLPDDTEIGPSTPPALNT